MRYKSREVERTEKELDKINLEAFMYSNMPIEELMDAIENYMMGKEDKDKLERGDFIPFFNWMSTDEFMYYLEERYDTEIFEETNYLITTWKKKYKGGKNEKDT